MLAYQVLFLAATISSTSIVLTDILVQPGYEHLYRSNQYNHQPVLQYNRMSSPTERHAEQLTTQQLMQHHPEVHTYPYYRMYHNPAPLNLAISHQSHHFTYLPKPAGHLHYMKVKGYGHTQHPMFVGLPYPLTVCHQYRRSCKSDPTGTESSESTTTKHEDEVATKPSLIDVKHSAVNDSLLPENEPTDTDKKRVENRQSKNDHAITRPFLFGLNPERMYPRYRQIESLNATKQSFFKALPTTLNTPKLLDKQSAANSAQSIEPTQILSTTEREQDQKESYIKQEDHCTRNMFSKDLENSSSPTQTSSIEESSDEEPLSAEPETAIIIRIPCVSGNQSHTSFVVEFEVADFEELKSGISVTAARHDEALSGSDKIIDSPNLNTVNVPFATQTFYVLSNKHIAPFATYYKGYDYSYSTNPDYIIYKTAYTRDNLASTDTMTLLDVSRVQQFSDRYNYPTKMKYVPLPETRKYYYVTPATTSSHVPLYQLIISKALL
ncbi:hypothetical protein DMN91_001314 [Ooceraea biroi]|uniref:DUF4794 domain-containing protein n=1 Tax=Ooceraea biroi TaxID=2015173 RepID=A0A026WEJ7_OOCBI|nr:hypothetical protein X777_05499 [Ooceraea biroi]RLU27510.1 hypothetical protein DMN91_001314 [Ooceraea biroi]